MLDKKNYYLIDKLENAHSYMSLSFSNRYMNWKRFHSVFRAVSGELKGWPPDRQARILDLGCGEGGLIYSFKSKLGYSRKISFTGMDLSIFRIDFAAKRKEYFGWDGCDFIAGNAERLPFVDGVFDVIICSEVAEHIPDSASFLKQMYRALKEGGLLILTTPNAGGNLVTKILRPFARMAQASGNDVKVVDNREESKSAFSSAGGTLGVGNEHISVKPRREWFEIFREARFKIEEASGTSGIFFGSQRIDVHRVAVGLGIVLDTLLERLPFSYLWSECLFFRLRK